MVHNCQRRHSLLPVSSHTTPVAWQSRQLMRYAQLMHSTCFAEVWIDARSRHTVAMAASTEHARYRANTPPASHNHSSDAEKHNGKYAGQILAPCACYTLWQAELEKAVLEHLKSYVASHRWVCSSATMRHSTQGMHTHIGMPKHQTLQQGT